MKPNRSESGALGQGLTLLFVVVLAGGQSAAATELLFDGEDVFDLTIRAPITRLMRQAKDADDVFGSLELADGTSVPMSCNKYGISRLRECELAALAITVEAADVQGTPFDGLHILRLVTPCRLRGNYDKYTMLEYLVYRSYAVIADPALRVRLVQVQFQDSEKPGKDRSGYAFFIEDIGAAAARGGQAWLDIESQEISDLDAAQLTVMTLFQYMVGNTDWSAVRGRPDDRCCHNVAVFGEEGGGPNTVVPFDFDQTGLVNPPYAAPPDPSLGIRWVTDRSFRGLCEHNAEIPEAVRIFNDRRSELEALFNDDGLPYAKAREHAWQFVEGFYDTINDPRKFEKSILEACR